MKKNSPSTYIIIIVVIIVLILGVLYLLFHKKSTANTQSSASTSIPVSSGTNSSNENNSSNSATTITYNGATFSPDTITVPSGTTVTIKNTSSQPVQFDSDPHPVHTGDPELNVGLISAGSSGTVTATTKGRHGYHNHLDASQTGTIIVN